MIYNTENRASVQKLPDKSQSLGKRYHINTKYKYLSETTRVDQLEPSVQSEQAGLWRSRGIVYKETANN